MRPDPGELASAVPAADAPRATWTVRAWPWLVFVLVLGYGLAADPYNFVYDDGGITLRYAERLAEGRTGYVDGERVNGASSPLYTAAAAALLALGIAPEWAVRGLAAVGAAGALALVCAAFARRRAGAAGLFAALLALGYARPFELLYSGLETPFSWLTAALLCAALWSARPAAIGAALGLCVASKLDGGLALVAYVLVELVRTRRVPLRALAVAAAVVLPVLVASWIAFGSPLPNSLFVKLAHGAEQARFDPAWMPRVLLEGSRWSFLGALGGVALVLVHPPSRRTPAPVLALWLALHLGAHATIRAGGEFPWYAATPQILCCLLSGFLVHGAGSLAADALAALRGGPRPVTMGAAVAHGVALLGVAGVAFTKGPLLAARLAPSVTMGTTGSAPAGIPPYGAGDLARAAAGAWLRAHTSGAELLATPYGLPAYEYGGPVYDESGLNSARDPARAAQAAYQVVGPVEPGRERELARAGRTLVAVFQYDARAPLYGLAATRSSEIVAQRLAHRVPGLELPAAADPEGWLARATHAPLAVHELKLGCPRWRDRVRRVEAGERLVGRSER